MWIGSVEVDLVEVELELRGSRGDAKVERLQLGGRELGQVEGVTEGWRIEVLPRDRHRLPVRGDRDDLVEVAALPLEIAAVLLGLRLRGDDADHDRARERIGGRDVAPELEMDAFVLAPVVA